MEIFTPHPNFSDPVNSNIVRSEIEGGVYLRDLLNGDELEVQTEHRWYHLRYCGDETVIICGHPRFCPTPTRVRIHGSTWGGSMIKMAYIGRGMHLEFRDADDRVITTSRILEIRER